MAGDYYAAFMDESAIEHLGMTPLVLELKSIQGASSRNALAALMGGLDASYAPQRNSYKTYITKLLALASWPRPPERAEEILQFETSIAEASWDREQERDSAKTYNPMTLQRKRPSNAPVR